jgi:hypothetical protein
MSSWDTRREIRLEMAVERTRQALEEAMRCENAPTDPKADRGAMRTKGDQIMTQPTNSDHETTRTDKATNMSPVEFALEQGRRHYGNLNIATDPRDWVKEGHEVVAAVEPESTTPHIETSGAIVKVQFDGDEIEAIPKDGRAWVVVRRVCEALGIDENGQRRKLQTCPWATTVLMSAVAKDGKIREVFALDLDRVPMWLASINSGKVRPELREKLVRYQCECTRVLRDHFFGKQETPAPVIDQDRLVDVLTDRIAERLQLTIRPAAKPSQRRVPKCRPSRIQIPPTERMHEFLCRIDMSNARPAVWRAMFVIALDVFDQRFENPHSTANAYSLCPTTTTSAFQELKTSRQIEQCPHNPLLWDLDPMLRRRIERYREECRNPPKVRLVQPEPVQPVKRLPTRSETLVKRSFGKLEKSTEKPEENK